MGLFQKSKKKSSEKPVSVQSLRRSIFLSSGYASILTGLCLLTLSGCAGTKKSQDTVVQISNPASIAVKSEPAPITPLQKTFDKDDDSRLRPTAGTRGMVVSDDTEASAWGAEVLRRGGNAVDAAVATALAMSVSRPHFASLGGGGFMIYCPPSSGDASVKKNAKCSALDYREMAPLKSTRDMYIRNGKPDTNLSQNGALASGVPGVPAGLLSAAEKWGKIGAKGLAGRKVLFSKPIEMAKKGVIVSTHTEAALHDRWSHMNQEARRVFGVTGRSTEKTPVVVGSRLKQPDLAEVLEAMRNHGRDGFYKGSVAMKIAKGLQAEGGIISTHDLARYQPMEREPVSGERFGYEVISMPPPSSGGAILLQILKYAELADQGGMFAHGFYSAPAIHSLIHAESLAFADRAEHFGDPDFYKVPLSALLSDSYLTQRWTETFKKDKRNWPSPGKLGTPSAVIVTSEVHEGANTTHLSVVDREGGSVSLTTTVNDNFGSAFVPPGTGIVMNNQMDDFSIQPGTPNLFGLVGAEANAIAPGKRPLSSMSPTIVRKNGEVRFVLGAQGGPRIITATALAFLLAARFDYSLPDAVHGLRFHHQWKPESVKLERGGWSHELKESLTSMGYKLEETSTAGKMHAIERFPEAGRVWGVNDLRAEGGAVAE